MSFIPKNLLKEVKQKLDALLNFKNVLLETIDGWAIGYGLDYLDENYADEIPEAYREEVILLLEAFAYGDYDKITDATILAIDDLVNLPFMQDDVQAQWVACNVKALKDFIVWVVNKSKE
jgi:hypothetical protein